MFHKLFLQKYQPLTLDAFESVSEIKEILTTLIQMNNLNILFVGNIGSGKTTYLNATIQEYYNNIDKSLQHDNILYINSLKEQGINFYRNDVKTFCQTCCTIKHKKKIIVLDDIDIINEQSQQVFRNCIDKYSKNVHFISSCSNPQKVIETIQSRFTIIKINSVAKTALYNISNNIISTEKLSIDDKAHEFIINISNNNPKILINYMEKVKLLGQHIDIRVVTDVCANISFFIFEDYIQLLLRNDIAGAIKLLYDIYDKGYSVMDILDTFFIYVKLTNKLTEKQKYNAIPIICKYIMIFHNIHEDEIELALFTNNFFKMLL